MKIFADTNFFTNLWTNLSDSAEADRLWSFAGEMELFLAVTRLVNLEYTNALQRLVYESKHGAQALNITSEIAAVARLEMDQALSGGKNLLMAVPDESLLDATFESLVYRHTATRGFRTADILHIASALVLGCDTFWSFDGRAKNLAKLEGLRVNP